MVVLARERGISIPFDVTAPGKNSSVNAQKSSEVATLARRIGIAVSVVQQPFSIEESDKYPALAVLKNGITVLLRGYNKELRQFRVFDPLAQEGGELNIDFDKFIQLWSGVLYELLGSATRQADGENLDNSGKRESWVKKQLLPYRSHYWGVVTAGFFVNIFSLVSPFFMMIVLDRVISHAAWTTLTVLGIGVTVIIIFESVFDYLKNMILLTVAKNADVGMQTALYAHFIGLPYGFIKHGQKGIWQKTLMEPERIRGFLTNRVLSTGIDLLFVFIFALALLWMNIYLFAIAIIAAALQLLLGSFASPLLRHRINENMTAENRREAFLAESIATVDIIKAAGVERTNYRHWKAIVTGTIENRHKLQTLLALVKAFTGFIDKFVGILVIWVGAALIMTGELSVGILVASSILCRRITSPVMQLATLLNDYHEVRASIQAIDKIASQPLEEDNSTGSKIPIKLGGSFELESVRYRYPGNQAFDIFLNLSIEKDNMVAIVGTSGSGKSTLTRLLLGLVSPIEGVIRVDGHDLKNLDVENYRNQIGTVLQDIILFRDTVRENISYGLPGATLNDVVEAAKMAGADDFIQRLPEGYGTLLDESASNLSGGQRQRISLARAIIRNPKVLILDEATSALDPESESIIIQNLQALRKNRTVIIVTHRLSAIVKADMILFMDNGKVIASGNHRYLLETSDQYRDMWNAQSMHFEHD